MKAAIVAAPGTTPVYADFQEPASQDGLELIHVTAAALSNLTKGSASGSHYSADNQYPFVPGMDGVGTTADNRAFTSSFRKRPLVPWPSRPWSIRAAPSRCPTA